MMTEILYFDCVPDEIFEQILTNLTLEEKIISQNICRRFYHLLSNEKWNHRKHLHLYIYNDKIPIVEILEKINPEQITIHLKKVFDNMSEIIKRIEKYIPSSFFDYNFGLKLIKKIQIVEYDFSNLTELTDYHLDLFDDETKTYKAKINLSGCTSITSEGITKLKEWPYIDLSYCTQLKSVSYGTSTARCYWDNVPMGITKFGRINLTGCTSLDTKNLHLLSDSEVIILDYCPQITDDNITDIRWRLVISLKGCIGITGRFLDKLKNDNRSFKIVDRDYIDNGNIDGPYEYFCIDDCPNLDPKYKDIKISEYRHKCSCEDDLFDSYFDRSQDEITDRFFNRMMDMSSDDVDLPSDSIDDLLDSLSSDEEVELSSISPDDGKNLPSINLDLRVKLPSISSNDDSDIDSDIESIELE